MISVKYIDPEEYTEEGEAAYDLAKNSEINILSDKELYAITTDNEIVTGALFVNNDSDSFSFDVVIHPEYRRQGIGRELSKVAMSEYEDRKDIYGDSYYLMVDAVNEMFAEFLIKEYGLNIYEKQGDHTLLTDKEIDEDEGYSEDDNLMESSNGNMVASRIKTETNLLLDHGADGKYTKLKDNTYLCEEGSYVPRNYADNVGGYVITCKVDSLKVLDLSYENRDNLNEQPGGFKISGTDPEMYSFIHDVISPESAEKYSQYGLNVFSKILGGMNHLDKLIKYAKSLGCDALKFRDESFDTMMQDFTYVVFDGNKLQVVNIVDPESEEEWKVSEGDIVLESLFVDFINQFKTQDNSNLIEAITNGYLLINESSDYVGEHEAPDKTSGAPLHDLSSVYPDDIYGSDAARMYGDGVPYDNESISIIKSVKGKPKAKVKIYRAVPDFNKENVKKINELSSIISYFRTHNFFPRTDLVDSYTEKYYKEGVGYVLEYDEMQSKVLDDIRNDIESLESTLTNALKINPGDWVTLSRSYAKEHGEGNLNNKYKILTKTVPASTLYSDGNSIHEWGYDA
jgi:GNAT superfamily N-acetyltransferase